MQRVSDRSVERAKKLLILLLSVGTSLFMAEMALRMLRPQATFGAGEQLPQMLNYREEDGRLTIDPEFGFRPTLGNRYYSRYGTLIPGYANEMRPDSTRLLFVGDSVTQRGRIVRALRALYGTEKFEYWNAGVGSFNTLQEVKFYRMYNSAIEPNHVILTFHPNDFETTPVAFYHEGWMVAYAPSQPLRGLSPWLFGRSHLYRLIVGLSLSRGEGRAAIEGEVRASLRELRDRLERDGIAFSVIVHPYLLHSRTWSQDMKRRRALILEILTDLRIQHYDLLAVSDEAIREGVQVQESPGDSWHPSDAAAAHFARYLYGRGLVKQPGGG